MGGAQSLFAENDWNLADGQLDQPEQTIDGAAPTAAYQTFFLVKKAVLANQREFDVTDSTGSNLLFHVRPSLGTIAGFDVLGIGSATKDDYILRVTVDIARRHWIVYRFDKPVFEGQKPDETATMKFATEQQTERKELAARITASLAIHAFPNADEDSSTAAQPPLPVPKHFLYKVCCITVSWSRYMAVAAYFGPPTLEQLLASKKHTEAVQELLDSEENDEDDGSGGNGSNRDDDLLLQASKIAERMRDRRALADDLEDESERSDGTCTLPPPISNNGENNDVKQQALAETTVETADSATADTTSIQEKDDANAISPAESSSCSGANSNDQPELIDSSDDKQATGGNETTNENIETQEEKKTVHPSIAGANCTDTDAPKSCAAASVVAPCELSPAEPTADTDGVEDQGKESIVITGVADDAQATGKDEPSTQLEPAKDEDEALPTDLALTSSEAAKEDDNNDELEIKTSQSMPELSYDAYAAKHADKLRTWFKETGRTINTKTMSILRQTHSFDDVDGSGGGGYAAFLGISKSTDNDDPLEGVIHLEKPLLLCQEIYTRIIGNHQTSRVSKDKVLTLLKQDMEQRAEGGGGGGGGASGDASNADKTDTSSGSTSSGKIVETKIPSPVTKAKAPSDSLKTTPASSVVPTVSVESDTKNGDAAAAAEPEKDKEQPLVGYWAWEHSLRTHKIKMHLAKGSDLALHVVLAVLVNQVRYERNAIAIAV